MRNARLIKLELTKGKMAMIGAASLLALLWMFILGVVIGRNYTPRGLPAPPARRPLISEPGPAEEAFQHHLDAEKKVQAASSKRAEKRPPAKAAPKPCYTLQVGAFKDGKRAAAYARTLRAKGLSASLSPGYSAGELWHRVRLGRYGSRPEAERAAARLVAQLGKKPYILPAD